MNNVKIIGSGSWLPKTRISSQELMKMLNTGKPLTWVEEKLGIINRALSISLPDGKPTPEVPSAARAAEIACRHALEMAKTAPEEIQHLFLVTCTPDEHDFKFTTAALHAALGLDRKARINEVPSGCAGLIEVLDMANAYLRGVYSVGAKVLVAAVNLTSPFFVDWQRYVSQREWISAVIFADGACALVLESREEKGEEGILASFFETDGTHPLLRHPAGGVLMPITAETMLRDLYSMNPREVEEYYRAAMMRNFERLREIKPDLRLTDLHRVYVHQASPATVRGFRVISGLGEDVVPLIGDQIGNPSAAVTGIMFDNDWRSGRLAKDNLILFSVVGAGAINGAVLLRF